MLRKVIIIIIAVLLVLSFVLPLIIYGQENDMGPEVRVALFMEWKNRSLPVRDVVTFSPSNSNGSLGVQLVPNEKVSVGGALSFGSSGDQIKKMKASLFAYHAELLDVEEQKIQEILNLSMALSSKNLDHVVRRSMVGGTLHYHIDTAHFASVEALKQALPSYQSVLKQVRGDLSRIKMRGPYGVSLGYTEDIQQAYALAKRVQADGYEAMLGAKLGDSNNVLYTVVVGALPDQSSLINFDSEIMAYVPAWLQSASISNAQKDFISPVTPLIRMGEDLFFDNETRSINHLYVPLQGVMLSVQEKNGGTITVEEKGVDGRSYRGRMILTRYGNRLAVLNGLPREAYLYGVVGTEMSDGWPLEALKAQAVLARTYLIGGGIKYNIAHISDTTYDQAYTGVEREGANVRKAVDATRGEVLTIDGKLASAVYSSNAGGISAHGLETWGNDVPYMRPVLSPDDGPEKTALHWYRVATEDGKIGYIRSDLVNVSNLEGSTNVSGFPLGRIQTSASTTVNLRPSPGTERSPIGSVLNGAYVTILQDVPGNNAYGWIDVPIDGWTLMQQLMSKASKALTLPLAEPVQKLEVTARGESGRVKGMRINDVVDLMPTSPDNFRSYFAAPDGTGSLRSTLFEVEPMAEVTILAAGGLTSKLPEKNRAVSAIRAGGQVTSTIGTQDGQYVILGGKEKNVSGTALDQKVFLETLAQDPARTPTVQKIKQGQTVHEEKSMHQEKYAVRVASFDPRFRMRGYGYGHGLGLSQFGAKALAEAGVTYREILQTYFSEKAMLEQRP